jgi:uncharacterized protein
MQLIETKARLKKVQQTIIEKDYALSYLLAAISATVGLGDQIVLKGGTALKKLYFPDYRFSEDLDYSTRTPGSITGIDGLVAAVVTRMTADLNARGPFQVVSEPLLLKQPHPGGQSAYRVRVQFPGQHQPLCRLKVEITVDEPVLMPVEVRPVLHDFNEDFKAGVAAYSLLEITAEKLRALLQSKSRLEERGWGASRVCRDYYDLWHLLQVAEVRTPELLPLVKQKCTAKGISYISLQDFITSDLVAVAESEWQQQLLPFVPNAPPANAMLPDVKSFILSL